MNVLKILTPEHIVDHFLEGLSRDLSIASEKFKAQVSKRDESVEETRKAEAMEKILCDAAMLLFKFRTEF